MNAARRYRWVLAGAAVVLVVGFLLFRPDKLFVDDRVDESLADAFPTRTTVTTTTSVAPQPSTTSAPAETSPTTTTTSSTTTTTLAATPVAIATGSFFGIDHSATGTATVYEQDGSHVLRFEDDTDIQNGPDLWVWVLAADEYAGGSPGTYIELGKIKGNVGGQNYELPDEFDPDVHQFVLIWCKRFSVPFAASPLV